MKRGQHNFLETTIRSVIDQSYRNVEHIIIDGGSTDNSLGIIEKYKEYLAYWTSQKDGGQAEAINKGLRRATGDILAWINSDDVYLPGAFEKVSKAFEVNPDADVIYGDGVLVDESGNEIARRYGISFNYNIWFYSVVEPFQPEVFYRRRAIEKAGLLDESFHMMMDREWWIRMAKCGCKFVHIPVQLAALRVYGERKSAKFQKLNDEERWRIIVVSEFLKSRAVRLGFKQENILKQIKGVKFAKIPNKQIAKRILLPESEKDAIVFTYVGSIYESDLNLMFRAFEKVSDMQPEVRLRLIGYNRKRPIYVPDNVRILPRIPDEDYYMNIAATDVFLLPLKSSVANISRYPSKFGDYLASGRPVISTPHPEISRIINTAACGYISESDSIDTFSETILKALKDRNQWETLGQNARDYASNYLAWNSIAKTITAFYNQIALKEKV